MTIQEKKIALDALYYEIWMLNGTFCLLSCLVVHPTSLVDRNATLESFLVHTRNLVYFLGDKMDSRDIRCSDFGVPVTNVSLPSGNSIDEINQYLSHLTKSRVLQNKPNWEIREIRNEVNKGIQFFISMIDPTVFPTNKGRGQTNFIF